MGKKEKIQQIKNIARYLKIVTKRKLKPLSPILLALVAHFGGGQTALGQNARTISPHDATLSGLYARASVSYGNLPPVEAVCAELNKITLEEAAWDRTIYVFNAVVDSMNNKADQAERVWKNPTQKQKFVKEIMYEVSGSKRYASSCIATCSYAVFKAFDALSDTTEIIPQNGKTFGNAFLSDPTVKQYTISIPPKQGGLQEAIEENNIRAGDFILIPRNKTNYHTVMYVGKDENGNHIYSASNNPACKKDIDYYNKQAIKWGRPSKIVKCNEMYKDKFLTAMEQLEQGGMPKEDILVYVYSTMGQEENILNDILKNIIKIRTLDRITPFTPSNIGALEKPDLHPIEIDTTITLPQKTAPKKKKTKPIIVPTINFGNEERS